MSAPYEFDRYVCTKETLLETLSDYGVAVIPGVLNAQECNDIVDGVWNFFEHISQTWEVPINRNVESSWRGFYSLYPLHAMLVQYWGIGHAQVSWDVRQNPKIVKIFAHLWTDILKSRDPNADEVHSHDMLVSFDGLSMHLPPEVTKRGWNREHTWYHTDQSFVTSRESPGLQCVQSFVTGLDINEYDATFSFMECSHEYHADFGRAHGITNKANWYKLSKDEEMFFEKNDCPIKNIRCPKGSMVFWDSRTIHCGIEARRERKVPNLRAVIYVCYMPRSFCTDLEKKRKAFNEKRTTSHYPCKIRIFPKIPRTYGGDVPEITQIDDPVLTDLGKRLAGF